MHDRLERGEHDDALTRAYRVRPDCEAGLRNKYFVETCTQAPAEIHLSKGIPKIDDMRRNKMTKGKWLSRVLHVTIALSFVLGALVVAPSVSADPGTSKWEKQGTPTEDDKVILPGSDILDFDVAGDGETIYAIGTWYDSCGSSNWWIDPGELPTPPFGPADLWTNYHFPKLWKSTDGGITWSDKTSKVLDSKNLPDLDPTDTDDWEDFTFFSNVSVAPDDPDFVVVAGWGYNLTATPDLDDPNYVPVVVGSNDGAGKFYYMGCSTVSGIITALDVSMEVDDKHSIAVGTWDWEFESPMGDNSGGGGGTGTYDLNNATVWRYDAGGYWSAYWADTSSLDGWYYCDAIVDIEFSPNFDVDDTVVVLAIGDVNDPDANEGDDDAPHAFADGVDQGPGDATADGDSVNDYSAFMIQAGTWNSIDAWNAEAEFDNYPVVIMNDDYAIVSPIDINIGSEWDAHGLIVRNVGDIDLPMDYMGDDTSDRKVMVAVNGVEMNLTDDPDAVVDDGGFMFWVENTTISLELLDHEDNPYIASIDYYGNIDMEGRTMVGLMFPKTWRYHEVMDFFESGGTNPALGCCNGVGVLYSETTDVCCPDWDWSCKPPTGQFNATVMMNPDGDWAFASTMGASYLTWGGWWSDESAFSLSGHVEDLGKAWNQSALIDTDIDFISDVAVTSDPDGDDVCSPSCSCIYLATINTDFERGEEGKICDCDSIWRSCDGGDTWLRIWNKALAGSIMDPSGMVAWGQGPIEWMELGLPPGDEEPEVIYMADLGTETIWMAEDTGACCPAGLGCWTDRNTGLDEIADFAVLDETTLYCVDLTSGDLVKSTTKGRHWSSTEDSEVCDDDNEWAHDIICWGDWVVLGGSEGTVSYSDDGGDSFSVLDDIGDGYVHVAFDSYFDDNGYVYAAVGWGDNGIYRTTIDDADFKDMDACTEVDYFGIVVGDADGNPMTSSSTGGVLYASYNGSEGGDCKTSGVARILNPASQNCCGTLGWDYLFDNLCEYESFANEPTDIELCGDASGGATTIFAIGVQPYLGDSYYDGWCDCYTEFCDSCDGRLWKFNDVFSKSGPELIGVADGATIPSDPCDCVNEDFVLEWDRLCDACEYDIEIAIDEGFKHKVWKTSTICAEWSSASCVEHDACGLGVLAFCGDEGTFYKPSDPCAPSIVVPQGTLDCNQQYWWRVRARAAETGEAYRSWWSDKWSFTVAVGPDGAIKLTAPDDGATNVPLESIVFTWTAVADADSYEMVLMDSSGAEIASNSGDVTSFVLTSKLDYDSAYMWQVKAMKGSNVLSESGVSTFRTMMQPTDPPEIPETVINFPEPAGTPSWVWVVIALAAILIIVVIVLIFRTRRV
jgi:hypothetical protein